MPMSLISWSSSILQVCAGTKLGDMNVVLKTDNFFQLLSNFYEVISGYSCNLHIACILYQSVKYFNNCGSFSGHAMFLFIIPSNKHITFIMLEGFLIKIVLHIRSVATHSATYDNKHRQELNALVCSNPTFPLLRLFFTSFKFFLHIRWFNIVSDAFFCISVKMMFISQSVSM